MLPTVSIARPPAHVGNRDTYGIPKFSFIAAMFRILQCAKHRPTSLILTAVKGYVNDLIAK